MADLTQLLNPVNILDIAIVAIFIYKLISMVKGTRAVQLIKGLLLLLVLSAISSSNVLGLTTVNWILEQIKIDDADCHSHCISAWNCGVCWNVGKQLFDS